MKSLPGLRPFAPTALLLIAACAEIDAPTEALAQSKLSAGEAVAKASEVRPDDRPVELELEMQDDRAVFAIDVVHEGALAQVVIDAATGEVLTQADIEMSDKEIVTLRELNKIDAARRTTMAEAIARAIEQTGGGTAFEVDLTLRAGQPIFVVQVLKENERMPVTIPVKKAGEAPTEEGS